MGNNSTKESRPGDAGQRSHRHPLEAVQNEPSDRSSRRNRISRGDFLGIGAQGGSGSHAEPPYERRETRQEREARRLERERVARIAERERSMKEEHVDGGFLVTMGTYVGTEDFNKQIVRQLQIERKIAPFWRGLNDFNDQWTEPQIIAAARGLPVPPPDQTPPDDLIPRPLSAESPRFSAQNLNNLTVPMGDRTQSAASDHSVSNTGSALPSPITGHAPRTSSPFKPRGKALAAVLGGSSRNGSTTEIVPREINLPYDPFVNGQPLEVFLYKDATECPICFLTYPPYLNHTRCCDQPICSECFVQIKRPDPHFPEGHNENSPDHNPEQAADQLVSEPACCPYCTQPEFGVTYEPPPFRRGLTYGISPPAFGSLGTAMSSSSSLNSGTPSPAVGSPTSVGSRRRTQSLSASSPNVISTDRIRPEWSTKLQTARAHLARRAAAATALHTAAFLMSSTETRPGRSRFGRRSAGSGLVLNSSTAGAPSSGANNEGDSSPATPSQGAPDPSARGSSAREQASGVARSRLEDLEEMMFMEAIRLSLAAEEERKRKEEKEEKKEAKKREKEDRKAAKAAARQAGPYEGADGRSGQSSASGSSLSLPGFGRKRGNSGASNLRVEASVASAMATGSSPSNTSPETAAKDKGKGIDRSLPPTAEGSGANVAETSSSPPISTAASRPVPTPHQPVGPSHLRQMSSASSVASSVLDSQPGSYASPSHLQDPRASGLSLGSRSGASEDGGDHERDPSASTEPMFNFRSLAEVVGVTLEGENAGRRLSQIEAERRAGEANSPEVGKNDETAGVEEQVESPSSGSMSGIEQSVATLRAGSTLTSQAEESQMSGETAVGDCDRIAPPKVTITPDTPAAFDEGTENPKQLGYETTVEHAREAIH
ncbi:hypothetical protein QBC34DRAFT_86275 [Podospora aff. communis PSN243]|uniref:Protein sip5 n=1 Tax=Podospora aff. communis PSN243 TaxID=3040156 RepID=A0AAV9GLZ6_9PEZI|nr:hypothetical protein QBC34DRAFT_86275 [Podospora aff. communis PSN243]